MNEMPLRETIQSLESCFSPLLETKGYHGSLEQQALGVKGFLKL